MSCIKLFCTLLTVSTIQIVTVNSNKYLQCLETLVKILMVLSINITFAFHLFCKLGIRLDGTDVNSKYAKKYFNNL